jgi:hypothetical protein
MTEKISKFQNEYIITNFGNCESIKTFLIGCYNSSHKQKNPPFEIFILFWLGFFSFKSKCN